MAASLGMPSCFEIEPLEMSVNKAGMPHKEVVFNVQVLFPVYSGRIIMTKHIASTASAKLKFICQRACIPS